MSGHPVLMPRVMKVWLDELLKAFDESKHPRHPAGSPKGGQFRPKGEARIEAASRFFDFGWRGNPGTLAVERIVNPLTQEEIPTAARADVWSHVIEHVGDAPHTHVLFHELAHLSTPGRTLLEVPFYGFNKTKMVESLVEIVARRALRAAGHEPDEYPTYDREIAAVCLGALSAADGDEGKARQRLDEVLAAASTGSADAVDRQLRTAFGSGDRAALRFFDMARWEREFPNLVSGGWLSPEGKALVHRMSWGEPQ